MKKIIFTFPILLFCIFGLITNANAGTIDDVPDGTYIGTAEFSGQGFTDLTKPITVRNLALAIIVANGKVTGIVYPKKNPRNASNSFATGFNHDYNTLKKINGIASGFVGFSGQQVEVSLLFDPTNNELTYTYDYSYQNINRKIKGTTKLQPKSDSSLQSLYVDKPTSINGIGEIVEVNGENGYCSGLSAQLTNRFISISDSGYALGTLYAYKIPELDAYQTNQLFFGKVDSEGKFKTIYGSVIYSSMPIRKLVFNVSDIVIDSNEIKINGIIKEIRVKNPRTGSISDSFSKEPCS